VTAVSDTYLNWALRLGRPAGQAQDAVFPLGFPTSCARDIPLPSLSDMADYRRARRIGLRSLVFSFAGTFGGSYDLATVITAAKELGRTRKDDIHFVIAGDGDNAARLRRAAAGVGNVSTIGWQDRQDLERLLQMSDVGLAPYIQSAKQSLPNKLYEYMAAGSPILSSLRGESRTLLAKEHVGLTYVPENVSSLIACVRRISTHPGLRRLMGERSLALFNSRFRAENIYSAMAGHVTRFNTASPLARSI
jgi:glycosyltransferase involved in cell wall biosynthesis